MLPIFPLFNADFEVQNSSFSAAVTGLDQEAETLPEILDSQLGVIIGWTSICLLWEGRKHVFQAG